MTTKAVETTRTIAESVGSLLRQARERREFDVKEVSERIKVPEKYLALLEDGSYDKLPEGVYTKIYLKAYCAFLGLNVSKVQKMYSIERTKFEKGNGNADPYADKHPATTIPAHRLAVIPKVVTTALIGLVLLALGIYFASALKKIVVPPTISLSAPTDGFVTTDRTIEVTGKTEPEVHLFINGGQVATDSDGNFHDLLTLQEGLNTIRIVGSKKYSKEMTVTRRVIVEPKERTTATLEGSRVTGFR